MTSLARECLGAPVRQADDGGLESNGGYRKGRVRGMEAVVSKTWDYGV